MNNLKLVLLTIMFYLIILGGLKLAYLKEQKCISLYGRNCNLCELWKGIEQ